VFFKIKRKDEWGKPYYIFELNEELIPEKEKQPFNKAWNIMKSISGKTGIKIFDSAEIMDAVQAKMKEIMESEDAARAMAKADETGELTLVRDIKISLFDHGTGRVTGLTLGVSVPAGVSNMMSARAEDRNENERT